MGDVQPLAGVVCTQTQVVATQSPAYERDLAQIRARTAVGATRESQQNGLVSQAMPVKQGFEFGQQYRQVTFAFGHCQATGGQGYTGDTVAAYPALLLVAIQAVLADQLVDFAAVFGTDIGDNQILVAGHAELALVNLGNFAHAGLQLPSVFIPDRKS